MSQRAILIDHPHIAPGDRRGVHAPSQAHGWFHSLIGQSRRLLRLLGEFAAAGGSLS